jgi:plastocyanin
MTFQGDLVRLSRVVSIVSVAAGVACGGDSAPMSPSGGQNPPPPGTVAVTIQDFSFSPASVTISAGTTVRWTNAGPSAHTTTSDDGAWASTPLGSPQGGDGYGGGSAGGTFDFKFTQAGTYSYHCSLHPPASYPGFTGTITVTP